MANWLKLMSSNQESTSFKPGQTVQIGTEYGGGLGVVIAIDPAGFGIIDAKGDTHEIPVEFLADPVDDFSKRVQSTSTPNYEDQYNDIHELNDRPEFEAGDKVKIRGLFGSGASYGFGVFVAYSLDGSAAIINYDGHDKSFPLERIEASYEDECSERFGETENDGALSPLSYAGDNRPNIEIGNNGMSDIDKWLSVIESSGAKKNKVMTACTCGDYDCEDCFPLTESEVLSRLDNILYENDDLEEVEIDEEDSDRLDEFAPLIALAEPLIAAAGEGLASAAGDAVSGAVRGGVANAISSFGKKDDSDDSVNEEIDSNESSGRVEVDGEDYYYEIIENPDESHTVAIYDELGDIQSSIEISRNGQVEIDGDGSERPELRHESDFRDIEHAVEYALRKSRPVMETAPINPLRHKSPDQIDETEGTKVEAGINTEYRGTNVSTKAGSAPNDIIISLSGPACNCKIKYNPVLNYIVIKGDGVNKRINSKFFSLEEVVDACMRDLNLHEGILGPVGDVVGGVVGGAADLVGGAVNTVASAVGDVAGGVKDAAGGAAAGANSSGLDEDDYDPLDDEAGDFGDVSSDFAHGDEHGASEDVASLIVDITNYQESGMSGATAHYSADQLYRMKPEMVKRIYDKVCGLNEADEEMQGVDDNMGDFADELDDSPIDVSNDFAGAPEHHVSDDVSDLVGEILYMQDLGMSNSDRHYTMDQLTKMSPDMVKRIYTKVSV